MKTALRLVASESTPKEADMADFRDSESAPVIDAIADALIGQAIRQKAREDFADWLASREVVR